MQVQAHHRFEQVAQIAVVVILVVGCYLVLRPFLVAMLFSAVICASTWPVFLWLRDRLRGRRGATALILSLLIFALIVAPVALLTLSLADSIPPMVDWVKSMLERGPIELPPWFVQLPVIGEQINAYWQQLAEGREELRSLVLRLLPTARTFLFGAAAVIGEGSLQLLLAVFIAFFFYRDGEDIMARLRAGSERLAGGIGDDLVTAVRNTVTGVAYGLIGTAIAQGVVATIGFLIAGVPAAFLLGAATFVLSLIPLGPVLIWGGAAVWLYQQDEIGWTVFMVLYGLLVISSVDNFIKPLLISRTSSMSLFMVVLGVFGGVLAFGFMGIFIGPIFLVLTDSLARRWLDRYTAQQSS
jgi:predicted PurR-regulated permease PerM